MFGWMRTRHERKKLQEAKRRAKHQEAHDQLESGLAELRGEQQKLSSDLNALGSNYVNRCREQAELENSRYSTADAAFATASTNILAAAEAAAARQIVAADDHTIQVILDAVNKTFAQYGLNGPVQEALKKATYDIAILEKRITELSHELKSQKDTEPAPSAQVLQSIRSDDAIAELMARAKAMQQSLANMERELWSQPSRPADPWEADIPVPAGRSNTAIPRRSDFTPPPPVNINEGTYAIIDPRTEAIIGYGQE